MAEYYLYGALRGHFILSRCSDDCSIATHRSALPFVPPVSRNGISARTTPNTSTVSWTYTLPVFGSGRSSSRTLPRETTTSCCFVPEKLPCTACVMPVARCRVRLYKNMVTADVIHFTLIHKLPINSPTTAKTRIKLFPSGSWRQNFSLIRWVLNVKISVGYPTPTGRVLA